MTSAGYATGIALPREDSPVATWTRRAITIPAVFAAALLLALSAPLWVPLAALVDLLRTPRTALRCGAFFTLFAWCELLGLLGAAAIWIATGCGLGGQGARARSERWSFALQNLWARSIFEGAARIFGFGLEVEGAEAVTPAPLLLLPRHVSIADTMLPAVLVQHPHGIRLRYVMKRELLWDPCLDVIGHRLPNYFARRDSGDAERERRGVAALAAELGTLEGVLIYPEGTRFTPERRARVLARLRRDGHEELGTRAEALANVLPPRLGGPLALIEACPDVDVVFCAHTGFERIKGFADLWNGALLGARIGVRFWRAPAAEIPARREARVEWLYAQWKRMDREVATLARGTNPTGGNA